MAVLPAFVAFALELRFLTFTFVGLSLMLVPKGIDLYSASAGWLSLRECDDLATERIPRGKCVYTVEQVNLEWSVIHLLKNDTDLQIGVRWRELSKNSRRIILRDPALEEFELRVKVTTKVESQKTMHLSSTFHARM